MSRRADNYASTRVATAPPPTVQGLCFAARTQEIFCSDAPGCLVVRSAIAQEKFVPKATIDLPPLVRPDAIVRSLLLPQGEDWVWGAMSSGELIAVHILTKKPVLVCDAIAMADAGPVVAMVEINAQGGRSTTPNTMNRLKVQAVPSAGVWVVTASRIGMVTLWDAHTRTRITGYRAALGPAAASVRSMCSWQEGGVVFLGTNVGGVMVVDARHVKGMRCSELLPPPERDGSAELAGGAIAAMAFRSGTSRWLVNKAAREADVQRLLSASSPRQPSLSTSVNALPTGSLCFTTVHGSLSRCVVLLGSAAEPFTARLIGASANISGVHRGVAHKVCMPDAHHIVTAGSDGSVAIVDALSMHVMQRVSLEDPESTVVVEMTTLHEQHASEVSAVASSVLLALSDRSFRVMGLKKRSDERLRTASTPAASARMSSRSPPQWRSSPTRSIRSHRGRDETSHSPSRPSSPAGRRPSSAMTTQELIHHCLGILKGLQSIMDVEPTARGDIERMEAAERDSLSGLEEYRRLGPYGTRRGAASLHLIMEEAAARRWWLTECAASFHAIASWQAHLLCHIVSIRDEDEVLRTLLLLERGGRDAIEHGGIGGLELIHRVGVDALMPLLSTLDPLYHEVTELRSRCDELETLVPHAVKLPHVERHVEHLEVTLGGLRDKHDVASRQLADVTQRHESLEAKYWSLHASLRLEQQLSVMKAEESHRHQLIAEWSGKANEMIALTRATEQRYLASLSQSVDDARLESHALTLQCRSLEEISVRTQRQLRDSEDDADASRSEARKLADAVRRLESSLEDTKRRLAAAEDQRHRLEMENVRIESKREPMEIRLQKATSLAEDTFQIVLSQQEVIRKQRHALEVIKSVAGSAVHALDEPDDDALDQHTQSIRHHLIPFDGSSDRLKTMHSLLRKAMDELAAARRDESAAYTLLESRMVDSVDHWHRHTAAAETSSYLGTAAAGELSVSETSTAMHIQQAFYALKCAAEGLLRRDTYGAAFHDTHVRMERRRLTELFKKLISEADDGLEAGNAGAGARM